MLSGGYILCNTLTIPESAIFGAVEINLTNEKLNKFIESNKPILVQVNLTASNGDVSIANVIFNKAAVAGKDFVLIGALYAMFGTSPTVFIVNIVKNGADDQSNAIARLHVGGLAELPQD